MKHGGEKRDAVKFGIPVSQEATKDEYGSQ